MSDNPNFNPNGKLNGDWNQLGGATLTLSDSDNGVMDDGQLFHNPVREGSDHTSGTSLCSSQSDDS